MKKHHHIRNILVPEVKIHGLVYFFQSTDWRSGGYVIYIGHMDGVRMKSRQPERQSAVALSYTAKDKAPVVVAKGYGVVAESIVQRAREHGLYVHESPELLNLLINVDLDDHIPPSLYVAVAELLAWLYRLDGGLPEQP